MNRPAPGRDQHGVEADVASGQLRMAGEKQASGLGDAAALARPDGFAGRAEIAARLDLDEEDQLAAPGDDVDLADWGAPIARQNAPAGEPQAPNGEAFAAPAGFYGPEARVRHCPPVLSSSARA